MPSAGTSLTPTVLSAKVCGRSVCVSVCLSVYLSVSFSGTLFVFARSLCTGHG